MAAARLSLLQAWLLLLGLALLLTPATPADPFAYFDWEVSYITAAPLGVKQQVFGSSFVSPLLLFLRSLSALLGLGMWICVALHF